MHTSYDNVIAINYQCLHRRDSVIPQFINSIVDIYNALLLNALKLYINSYKGPSASNPSTAGVRTTFSYLMNYNFQIYIPAVNQ